MGRISNKKRIKYSVDELYSKITEAQKQEKVNIPECFYADFNTTMIKVKDSICYYITPRKDFSGDFIFYLYGGNLCFNITKAELAFLSEMAKTCNMGIMLPMYPLTPEYCCKDVFNMLLPAYKELSSTKDVNDIYLMGRESGGGLAISLSIDIWKNGSKKPKKLILIEPMLDTEFFDEKLAASLTKINDDEVFFSESVKEFINKYWVKDMAARTEFTSPIYEDITDVCEDILLISGDESIFNHYAREFYDKSINSGIDIKFFEYREKKTGFILDEKDADSIHARKVLIDTLNGNGKAVLDKYMYEVKQRSESAKMYPEIFKDDIAHTYLCNHKINTDTYKGLTPFRKLILAATLHSFDNVVSQFLLRFPNGTVVYIGCSLDTMFERNDNGRVRWFNCDQPGKIAVRSIYVTDRERQKTVAKAFTDMNWAEDIKCKTKQGILFVIRDNFGYLKPEKAKECIEYLYTKFPGCEVVFDITKRKALNRENRYNKRNETEYHKKKFYMNDTERSILVWNTAYKLIGNYSIFSDIDADPSWKKALSIRFKQLKKSKEYKLVHLRLGNEKYKVNI